RTTSRASGSNIRSAGADRAPARPDALRPCETGDSRAQTLGERICEPRRRGPNCSLAMVGRSAGRAWAAPQSTQGADMTHYSEPEWPPQGGQPPQQPGGPPSAGQPGYEQPSYGQPPYGYPQQDQPPYGQPSYGPPSYGPPSYGPPSYGQPSYGPPSYGPPGGYPPGPGGSGFGPYGPPPRNRKAPWIAGGIAVLAVAGIAVALILTLSGNNSSGNATTAVAILL